METRSPELRKKRDDGRFEGYRVNCELVPRLPARSVRECLSDPRRVPYLLLWKHPWSGLLKEVVRLASPYPRYDWLEIGWAEVKRGDGSKVSIRLSQLAHKPMLICNSCQKHRLALYGWKTNKGPRSVSPALWPCRVCAGLSYASEGRALYIRRLFPELKPYWRLMRESRPDPWEPLVFASPLAAADAGLCSRSSEMPSESTHQKHTGDEAESIKERESAQK
jgi:hypothetical protein